MTKYLVRPIIEKIAETEIEAESEEEAERKAWEWNYTEETKHEEIQSVCVEGIVEEDV